MFNDTEENINKKDETKPLLIKLKSLDSSSMSSEIEDRMVFSSKNLIKYGYGISTNRPSHNLNNKEIFESEDTYIQKRNLFGSGASPMSKSELKKSNDVVSTEPSSIKVKNYNSPSKKYSVFKLIEKDKKRKFKPHFIEENKEKEKRPKKKLRMDIYGNIINKKNRKKIKISFIDDVTNQPLANVIDIESFKNYNYIDGMPKEEKMDNISSNCQCCLIF